MLPPNAPVRAEDLVVIRGTTTGWRVLRGATAGALLAAAVVYGFALAERPLAFEGMVVSAVGAEGGTDGVAVAYRHGERVDIALTIANRGRWGVTVTDILPARAIDVLPPSGVFLFPRGLGPVEHGARVARGPLSGVEPFRSFALRPGERRVLLVRARMANCGRLGGGDSLHDREVVRYRTLGIGREASLRLPEPIVVRDPLESRGCPFARHVSSSASTRAVTEP